LDNIRSVESLGVSADSFEAREYHADPLFSKSGAIAHGLAFRLRVTYECRQYAGG
jgi:hypothetical protein